MGGFAIRAEGLDLDLPEETTTLTLDEAGLFHLLDNLPGILPDLPESEILDKSKASTLAKSIVCLQALWFCIQCIARMLQGASISLLELNVLGHCLCTFVTYALWWKKPVDIAHPSFLITTDGLRQHISLMNLFSGQEESLPPPPTWPGLKFHGQPGVSLSDRPPPSYHPSEDSDLRASQHQALCGWLQQNITFGDNLSARMYVV